MGGCRAVVHGAGGQPGAVGRGARLPAGLAAHSVAASGIPGRSRPGACSLPQLCGSPAADQRQRQCLSPPTRAHRSSPARLPTVCSQAVPTQCPMHASLWCARRLCQPIIACVPTCDVLKGRAPFIISPCTWMICTVTKSCFSCIACIIRSSDRRHQNLLEACSTGLSTPSLAAPLGVVSCVRLTKKPAWWFYYAS